jgi:hypothetical protein
MAVAKFVIPDVRGIPRRTVVCPVPTDATSNASYVLTYTGDQLDQVDKTVTDENGSTTFRRTFGYTSGNLTSVSAWSEV